MACICSEGVGKENTVTTSPLSRDSRQRNATTARDQPGELTRASAQIETIVSYVLRYGVLLCFSIMFVGSVLLFIQGGSNTVVHLTGQPVPTTPGEVIAGALQLHPPAIIEFGLMLLIVIPVTHVTVSMIAFLAEGDLTYVAITFFVLAVIVASFVL